MIRGGALGDFILTLPVLSVLRKQFPKARIEILGYPKIACLAVDSGLAEAAYSIEDPALASFFVEKEPRPNHVSERDRWHSFFRRFDLVLSYLYDPKQIFLNNLSLHEGARIVQCPHRPNESLDTHGSIVFLEPVQKWLAENQFASSNFQFESHPLISIPRSVEPEFQNSHWIAVHPGSGSRTKNWPEEKWARLLALFMEHLPTRVLLVGGEAEDGILERLAARLPPERCQIAQSKPLPVLAGLLRCCSILVGHDSGVSHLAAAIGIDVVALWGPSRIQIWKPMGDKIHVLAHPKGLGALSEQTVFRTVQQVLNRS